MSNKVTTDLASVPVVILCGGNGIFVDDSGIRRNKALIQIEGQPMIVHVMRSYLRAGFRSFVLAVGYQADDVRAALSAEGLSAVGRGTSDIANPAEFEVDIGKTRCTVRLVFTGDTTTTGDRLIACRPYLETHDWFCATYSDTLSDIDLTDMCEFHVAHGKIATLVAAEYPTRFRVLGIRRGETQVRGFAARPVLGAEPINGGFYVFDRRIFDRRYLGRPAKQVVLENEVFDDLVLARELMAFFHQGAWQNLDNERDRVLLGTIVRTLRESSSRG